jgi:hypothetical protein
VGQSPQSTLDENDMRERENAILSEHPEPLMRVVITCDAAPPRADAPRGPFNRLEFNSGPTTAAVPATGSAAA